MKRILSVFLVTAIYSVSAQAQSLFDYLTTPRTTANSVNTQMDTSGSGLDGLQVQQVDASTYVGVYHQHQGNDRFCLYIGTAPHPQGPFSRATTVDCNYASQGSLQRLPDGKFVLAFEKNEAKRPFIQFRFYDSFAALLANQHSRIFSQAHVFGVSAQGTPNFRWIRYEGNPDTMTIEIGFHQNRWGKDTNSIGFLRGFKSFDSYQNTNLNNLVSKYASGHIGDRSFILFQGRPYTVVEAMTVPGDWLSWRLFLHDEAANTLLPLNLSTTDGSTSFGNGSLSYVRDAAGQLQLLFPAFVFGPSPNPGEHIFLTNVGNTDGDLIQNVGGVVNKVYSALNLPHTIGRAEADGWSARAGERGYLAYGPYERDLPSAPLRAVVTLMIDKISGNSDDIVNVEVYDADAKAVVAQRRVRRAEFLANMTYQSFSLNFDWRNRNGRRLEVRVYTYGKSYVKMGQLNIRENL